MDHTSSAHLYFVLGCIAASTVAQSNLYGVEHHGEYCDTEVFRAECAVGEVILMQRALYGRMQLGRCVETNLGYVGCHADVIRIVDARCSGRRTCEIRVPDTELERMRACLKELKTYLDVSYICLKVESVTSEQCEYQTEVNITRDHGFIASTAMLEAPSCDGSSHPWVIIAQPGQHINLTLYDFSAQVTYGAIENGVLRDDGSDVIEVCHEYGIVEDAEAGNTETICGGTRRVSHMYLSRGHVVKLWITNSKAERDLKYFTIEYTVIGCPDLPQTELTWFKRPPLGGDIAEMGCVYSDTTWQMRCEKYTWLGTMANCTQPVPELHDQSQRQNFPVTYGIAIAIIIGAVLGVALIICIVGLVRYRRRPRNRRGGELNGRETVLLQSRLESPYETKVNKISVASDNNRNHGDQTTIPNYKMANSAETTPCTPLCRHQRHQVTVNGNEYEHIWEAPFPVAVPVGTGPAVPEGRCTPTTLPRVSVANAHAAALAFSTFKAPDVIDGADSRTLPNPERPVYVSANDILRSPMTRRIIDKDGGKYSALEKVPSHHNVAPCSIIHANV